jgi:hypothetical protein
MPTVSLADLCTEDTPNQQETKINGKTRGEYIKKLIDHIQDRIAFSLQDEKGVEGKIVNVEK